MTLTTAFFLGYFAGLATALVTIIVCAHWPDIHAWLDRVIDG